jgi:cytochrome P450
MSETPTNPGTGPAAIFSSPEFLKNPYPVYRMMNAMQPVLRVPGVFSLGAWVVTDYGICLSALRSKVFGKEADKVVPPEKLKLVPQETGDLSIRRRSNMLFRDPPDHTRLRGLVSKAFTPRTVEQLRPHVVEIAERLLDAVEGQGSMDLIRDFAFPLPIIVIAELLGVPSEDRDRFKAWSTDLTLGLSPAATAEDLSRVSAAIHALDAYLSAVIEERRREPRADLISELGRAEEAGDTLSREEMVATCRLLLTAGHETTVNLIGNGMLALLRHGEERAALAGEPALLPNAIEELLRYDSPVQMTMRFAFEDAPLGTQAVKRGDLVVLLLGAANRDGAQFSDPDRLDLRRENAQSHLSLGSGIHYCLGAPLARIEGQIALGALLRRMPRLSLATEELAWRPNPVLHGLVSMPVTF